MNKYKRWEKEIIAKLNNMTDNELFVLLEKSGFTLNDLPETIQTDMLDSKNSVYSSCSDYSDYALAA
jgi:hypothetical protein